PGPRSEARRLWQRVSLALHRPPPEPQGEGGERHLRAVPLARLGVGGPAPDDPRARGGEPVGRAHQVGGRAGPGSRVPGPLRRRARTHDHAAGDRGPGSLATPLPPPARARAGARPERAVDGYEPGLPGGGRGRSDARPARLRALAGLSAPPRGVTFGPT